MRFVTYIPEGHDDVFCLSEQEFRAHKATPEFDEHGWDEWVWQEAPDKDTAVANHFVKMDEWHSNPDRETY